MVRIGVIGAGTHSRRQHGPALGQYRREHPDQAELAAVCDLDAAKARRYAEDFGFAAVYTDIDEMLRRERLDGLIAITPVDQTRAIVGRLLPRGIPLMLEKPPGRSSAETRGLLEIARRAGTPHMISFNRRRNPAVAEARRWLATAGAGRPPALVLARMLRVARREESFVTSTSIHAADTVLSFMPPPAAVRSRRWDSPAGGRCCEAQVAFADGSSAVLAIVPDCGAMAETYEIFGPEYCVRIDAHRTALEITDGGRQVASWRAGDDVPEHVACGGLGETEAFVRAVATGEGFSPDLAEGLASLLVAEAMDAGGTHEIEDRDPPTTATETLRTRRTKRASG